MIRWFRNFRIAITAHFGRLTSPDLRNLSDHMLSDIGLVRERGARGEHLIRRRPVNPEYNR